ncbi:hypothetical protein TrRE_jg4707 [Triparma retinervis]|uniref:Uncharacterized protein n=1 Tax=Triparma retinervis TaxID=2557542 RepID=A0A9W7ASJ0_9STRA|nr:hypothetical protein TrRE_jg4707 [Triparma retinervis]
MQAPQAMQTPQAMRTNPLSPPPPPATPPPSLDPSKCYTVTVLIQRVRSAKIESGEMKGEIEAGAGGGEGAGGLICYVSFQKGGDKDLKKDDKKLMEKIANRLFSLKLLEDNKNVKSTGGKNLVLIPSANLTCSLKGNNFQYHKQVPKERSAALFSILKTEVVKRGGDGGVFGEVQKIKSDSWSGPFMHVATF